MIAVRGALSKWDRHIKKAHSSNVYMFMHTESEWWYSFWYNTKRGKQVSCNLFIYVDCIKAFIHSFIRLYLLYFLLLLRIAGFNIFRLIRNAWQNLELGCLAGEHWNNDNNTHTPKKKINIHANTKFCQRSCFRVLGKCNIKQHKTTWHTQQQKKNRNQQHIPPHQKTTKLKTKRNPNRYTSC